MEAERCIWLSPLDRARLDGWAADRNTPQKPVWLARIVSMWAEGAGMTPIVRALGKTKEAAYAGVSATLSAASKGWRDASRLGRKRPLAAEMIARCGKVRVREYANFRRGSVTATNEGIWERWPRNPL
jgi:hypothetical protein